MKKTVVSPIGENVLIRPDKAEEKTSAGIYLPDAASEQNRQQIGEIIGIGDDDKIKVRIGNKVIFRKFVGEAIEIEGEEYLVTNYKEILAVIK